VVVTVMLWVTVFDGAGGVCWGKAGLMQSNRRAAEIFIVVVARCDWPSNIFLPRCRIRELVLAGCK
jgi:hypothetical protein